MNIEHNVSANKLCKYTRDSLYLSINGLIIISVTTFYRINPRQYIFFLNQDLLVNSALLFITKSKTSTNHAVSDLSGVVCALNLVGFEVESLKFNSLII